MSSSCRTESVECSMNPDKGEALHNAREERQKELLRRLEEMTSHPKVEQERFLKRVLTQNANAAYLQQFGLNGATDVQTFRQRVPISDYSMIQPFVRRIMEGEKGDILAGKPVVEYITSSGTSGGERKIYPVTYEDLALRLEMFDMSRALRSRDLTGLEKGKKVFFYHLKLSHGIVHGLHLRNASASLVMFEGFRRKPFGHSSGLTVSRQVIEIPDYVESMYCQLLCALYQREEVLLLSTFLASMLVQVLEHLKEWWPDLCNDLASGTLSKTRVSGDSALAAMKSYQRAEPQLAELVRQSCSQKSWKGIVRRVWPNCKALDVVATGSMQQYVSALRYLGDDMPIISSSRYGASEGSFGLNMTPMSPPEETLYTLCPSSAYYEFIPVNSTDEAHGVADLTSVKEGVIYDILVTTVSGLCRYRMGDLLEVVGSYSASPSFRVIGRNTHLQVVDFEKVEESELYRAMAKCAELLRNSVVEEFTSTVDLTRCPGHHVIYLELKNAEEQRPSVDLLEHCCCTIESTFNSFYRTLRFDGKVGPLELRIVRPKTFFRLAEVAASLGTAPMQYKTPRSISPLKLECINILDGAVIQRHQCQTTPARPVVGAPLAQRAMEFDPNVSELLGTQISVLHCRDGCVTCECKLIIISCEMFSYVQGVSRKQCCK